MAREFLWDCSYNLAQLLGQPRAGKTWQPRTRSASLVSSSKLWLHPPTDGSQPAAPLTACSVSEALPFLGPVAAVGSADGKLRVAPIREVGEQ